MTIAETLGRIDKDCFEKDYQVYDLRGLYESVRLTAQDKQELKKVIDSIDDSEEGASLIAAYLQTKETKNEGLKEDIDDCPICKECGKPLKINENTGRYFCPTCEDYLIEGSMDSDACISEDFWFEYNGKAYEAYWLDNVNKDIDEYLIVEFPDWDSTDYDEDSEDLFIVDGETTVGEVIEMIKKCNEDEGFRLECARTLYE